MRAQPRFLLLAALGALLQATPAQAQLLGPSFNAGLAVPARNEADSQESGFFLAAALKAPLLPLQAEVSLARMTGQEDTDADLTIMSVGAAVPISLTPPLVPLGIYLVAGGGLYRIDADTTTTDTGVSAGAGLSVGLGLRVFVEGRGVLVFADDKVTYLTAGIGLRF
jgi:hypothetical protein